MYEYLGEKRYKIFWLGGNLIVDIYTVKRLNKKTVTVRVKEDVYVFDIRDIKFKCVKSHSYTMRLKYDYFGSLDKDIKKAIGDQIRKMEVTYEWATKNLPLFIAGLKNLDVEGD